jgi:hypothetical protein
MDPAAMTFWEGLYTGVKRLHTSLSKLEKELKLRILPTREEEVSPETPQAEKFVRKGPKEMTAAAREKSKRKLAALKERQALKRKLAKEAKETKMTE